MNDQRCRLIVELLRSLELASSRSRDGVRGGGDGFPMLPHSDRCLIHVTAPARCSCWLKSVAELQRCLRLMYRQERRLWRACYERYVAAERRPREVIVRRGRPVVPANWQVVGLLNRTDLNKRGDGTTRVLVESWRGDVLESDWDRGVRWLAEAFDGAPQLPVEFLEMAA